MDPYLMVFPELTLFLVLVLLLFIHLTYNLIRRRQHDRRQIHTILTITTLLSFICSILCLVFIEIHLWTCYQNNPKQPFKSCYIESIHSKFTDTLLYLLHLIIYIHLFSRLKASLSGSYYSYSNKRLCCFLIPLYITIPCIILYQFDNAFIHYDLQLIQDITLTTVMVIDIYISIVLTYLFIHTLQTVIMDQSFSFEDFARPNFVENDDLGNISDPKRKSTQLLFDEDEDEEDIDTDGVVARQLRKRTFSESPVESTLHLMTRMTLLSGIIIISNAMYYITMFVWLFVMDKDDYTDVWIISILIGRGIDVFVNALLLYLFVYRYNHRMYQCLCSKCDHCCYECTRNHTRRQFKKRSMYVQ
eukprot:31327_1